jgi:flagellar hook-length control protein FliK
VPQVASDPKIHAHNHTLARLNRPTQQSDRAPSPFESLLDDGAQASEQPAPAPPENKTAPADSSQAPVKTTDSKPAVASDNGTIKQSNDADPLDQPDGDNISAANGKPVVDAKLVEVTAEGDSTKVTDDGKPKDAPKTDTPAITPPTDSIVVAPDKVTAAPVPAVIPPAPEQGKELSQQVPLVADAVPLLKPVDTGLPKVSTAKQTNTGNAAGIDKSVDDGQPVDETADGAQPAPKIATPHTDKPQFAANDADNKQIAQARGESSANGSRIATDSTASVSTDAGAATPNVTDNLGQPTVTAAPAHTAPTGAIPAAPATPPTLQAALIPLAGVPLEIASKALAGKNRFEIRLDPPELGRIEVRLDVDHDGNVTSRLIVDRADTLDLLRRDASGLERALQDAGLKTGDNGLQFALRDQSMNQQQTNSGPSTAQLLVTDETLPSIDTSLQNYGRLAGQGIGLDIRV